MIRDPLDVLALGQQLLQQGAGSTVEHMTLGAILVDGNQSDFTIMYNNSFADWAGPVYLGMITNALHTSAHAPSPCAAACIQCSAVWFA